MLRTSGGFCLFSLLLRLDLGLKQRVQAKAERVKLVQLLVQEQASHWVLVLWLSQDRQPRAPLVEVPSQPFRMVPV